MEFSLPEKPSSLTFSPDGTLLAIAFKNYIQRKNYIQFYDTILKKCIAKKSCEDPINAFSFDPQNKFLAISFHNRNFIYVYNIKKNDTHRHSFLNKDINSLVYSPKGYILVGMRNEISFFNQKTRLIEFSHAWLNNNTSKTHQTSISLSSDGNLLAIGSGNIMRLRDLSYFNKIWAIIKNKQLTIQQVFMLKLIFSKKFFELPPDGLIKKDWETLPQEIKKVILKKKNLKQKINYIIYY